MSHPNREEVKVEEFNGPKGICKCGHTGDGKESEHSATVTTLKGLSLREEGHGSCTQCGCKQFTWRKWTDAYRQVLYGMVRDE